MQYNMSGASAAPSIVPEPTAPQTTASPSSTPPKKWGWIVLFVVLVVGGLAWWLRPGTQGQQAADAKAAATRTTPVTRGILARTIRIAGTTGAQTYVSLIAPQ